MKHSLAQDVFASNLGRSDGILSNSCHNKRALLCNCFYWL